MFAYHDGREAFFICSKIFFKKVLTHHAMRGKIKAQGRQTTPAGPEGEMDMTYKKMAEMMIEKEACEWVKRLIPQGWEIWNAETTMEKHKDGDIMYDVEVTLWRPEHFNSGLRYTMTVGGCVSDYCGVCNSVIWRGRKGSCDVLWMNTKEAREELGIEEFALDA